MKHTLVLAVFAALISCNNRSGANPAPPETVPALKEKVDSIVIIKHDRKMEVYNNGRLLKVYHVSLGYEPVGPKHFKNDGKTPEGLYHIDGKNPNSHYHKCLGISYPSAADIQYAKRYRKPTGGDVKIHGLPNGHMEKVEDFTKEDWTWGCIALTDEEIDELYAHVAVGVWINILP
jgi:murein L,D-transpeptidase YafK